jgi:hypothetical protein
VQTTHKWHVHTTVTISDSLMLGSPSLLISNATFQNMLLPVCTGEVHVIVKSTYAGQP